MLKVALSSISGCIAGTGIKYYVSQQRARQHALAPSKQEDSSSAVQGGTLRHMHASYSGRQDQKSSRSHFACHSPDGTSSVKKWLRCSMADRIPLSLIMLSWTACAPLIITSEVEHSISAYPSSMGVVSSMAGSIFPAPMSKFRNPFPNWSSQTGRTIRGTPDCHAAASVPTPPWITRTEHFGKSQVCGAFSMKRTFSLA
mmetsp:Transcript_40684/g.116156  ORF Transcript_40684/g.116156 Transcript_40684/m.116156 type:complete len:200 (+) Transcript_40684:137-736(+)